jgi:peptide/nickel transport system permease protein
MVATIFVVASITFLVTNLIPGSVGAVMLGQEATDEDIRELEHRLGLDRPTIQRFVMWIGDLLRGDLGISLYHRSPVAQTILGRLEPTALLSLMAITIAIGVGLPLGILAAVRHRTPVDLAALVVSLLGMSIPNFWLGLNLILLFALYLGWFPTAGYSPIRADPALSLWYLVLPAVTLGSSQAALIARMTRANLLEVLRADYVRTARAKGLTETVVVLKHAMRNAMVPTVSVIGVTAALMVGGAVVTESVFAIPGVGRLMVESVLRRDFPMIQGLVLMIATAVALVNLAVDVLYAVLNPVIRYD